MKLYSKEYFAFDSNIHIIDISDKELLDNYMENLDNSCKLGFNKDYIVAYQKNVNLNLDIIPNSEKAEYGLHDSKILVSAQNVKIINNNNNYRFDKINKDEYSYVHTCTKYYTTYPKTHYGPDYELKDHIIYCF